MVTSYGWPMLDSYHSAFSGRIEFLSGYDQSAFFNLDDGLEMFSA